MTLSPKVLHIFQYQIYKNSDQHVLRSVESCGQIGNFPICIVHNAVQMAASLLTI